mmetsp:Transcript_25925/g.59907  ORF Transcript_25925/g.59907 Transcript_25925/m.59907 type:complete len:174 (+) Transcript_25925:34-555(+)
MRVLEWNELDKNPTPSILYSYIDEHSTAGNQTPIHTPDSELFCLFVCFLLLWHYFFTQDPQAQQQQQPYGNRRRPEAVRLPYMPSHRDPCQSPGASNQQLRVVRHVAGRTNVSVYHREAPDSARSRLSSHVPEFNPITHQRNYNNNNSNYTPGQYRYIPSPAAAAHGGNNWRG